MCRVRKFEKVYGEFVVNAALKRERERERERERKDGGGGIDSSHERQEEIDPAAVYCYISIHLKPRQRASAVVSVSRDEVLARLVNIPNQRETSSSE